MLFVNSTLQSTIGSDSKKLTTTEFDFAVIRYIWDENGGRDLDTRTSIAHPPRNVTVGWARQSRDSEYLSWGGDNTRVGIECVLFDLAALRRDYPQETYKVEIRAFWYSIRATGNLTVQFEMYKGGSMVQNGYDFVNSGGVVTHFTEINVNAITRTSSNVSGDLLANLLFNSRTLQGSLVVV